MTETQSVEIHAAVEHRDALIAAVCSAIHARGLWPILYNDGEDFCATASEVQAAVARHGSSAVFVSYHPH